MDTSTSNTDQQTTYTFHENGDYSWEYYVEEKLLTEDEFNKQIAHTSYYTA